MPLRRDCRRERPALPLMTSYLHERLVDSEPERTWKRAALQVDQEWANAEPADERSKQDDAQERALSRAIGDELRRAREAQGWTRAELVALLPSGIGDRTLLSYEHGTRHLTVLRLLELCRALRPESASSWLS